MMKAQALVPLLLAGLLLITVQHAAADGTMTVQDSILNAKTPSPNCGVKDQPCCSISASGCQGGLVCTTCTRDGCNPQAWYCRTCGGHEQPPCPGRVCKPNYKLSSNDNTLIPLCILATSDFNQQNAAMAERNAAAAAAVKPAGVRVGTAAAGAAVDVAAAGPAGGAPRGRPVDMSAGAAWRPCRAAKIWGNGAKECDGDFVCIGKNENADGTCYPPGQQ